MRDIYLKPRIALIIETPRSCHALQVTYFNFSRGLLVDHMDRRHLAAKEHLKDARKFAQSKAKDRENRLPPLTEEQREQLHDYLRLLAEREPEVYPNPHNLRAHK